MTIVGVSIFAIVGWCAAVYFSRRDDHGYRKNTVRLLASVDNVLRVPFVDATLRATFLHPKALSHLRNRNEARVLRLAISSALVGADVRNEIFIEGYAGKLPLASFPMMLLGGRVVPFNDFEVNHATLVEPSGTRTPVALRNTLDLGHFHLFEMIMPQPIATGQRFQLETVHEWPQTMTRGLDTMWYPYSLMFSRGIEELDITMRSDSELRFITGYSADLEKGTISLANVQPTLSDKFTVRWTARGESDKNTFHVLAFDRA